MKIEVEDLLAFKNLIDCGRRLEFYLKSDPCGWGEGANLQNSIVLVYDKQSTINDVSYGFCGTYYQ
jgi:hypothetical protein